MKKKTLFLFHYPLINLWSLHGAHIAFFRFMYGTMILAVRVSNGGFGRALFLDRGRATGVLDQLHNGILHSFDWFLSLPGGIRHLVEQFSEGQNSQFVLTGGCQGGRHHLSVKFLVSEGSASTAFTLHCNESAFARSARPRPRVDVFHDM